MTEHGVPDRLAEIEQRLGLEESHYPSWQDLSWLIAEVKRLTQLLEAERRVTHMIATEHKQDAAEVERYKQQARDVADQMQTRYLELADMLAAVRQDQERVMTERDELRAEIEYVKANYVTVAEEAQRRHDACAPLTAEIERTGIDMRAWKILAESAEADVARCNESAAAMLKVITEELPRVMAECDGLRDKVEDLTKLAQSYLTEASEEKVLAAAAEADVERLEYNMERAVSILTPLFVKAQEVDDPDEELLGGAMDVLTGWFGQTGKPLRKLDELELEVARLRTRLDAQDQVVEASRRLMTPGAKFGSHYTAIAKAIGLLDGTLPQV